MLRSIPNSDQTYIGFTEDLKTHLKSCFWYPNGQFKKKKITGPAPVRFEPRKRKSFHELSRFKFLRRLQITPLASLFRLQDRLLEKTPSKVV